METSQIISLSRSCDKQFTECCRRLESSKLLRVAHGLYRGCIPFAGKRKHKMIANRICPLLARLGSMTITVVTKKDRKLLGEGIRKYRKQEALTQEKLAEKVDINPVYMGQIERGYKIPTVDVLLRVAKALKVRLRDIVHEL